MHVERLDHLVLTVKDIPAALAFYTRVMGMQPVTFGDNRWALAFGLQKINLHQAGREFEPRAAHPTPGSADLCFITAEPIQDVIAGLRAEAIPIVEGPVRRSGALGPILSVYFRDPDLNLIEVSNYLSD